MGPCTALDGEWRMDAVLATATERSGRVGRCKPKLSWKVGGQDPRGSDILLLCGTYFRPQRQPWSPICKYSRHQFCSREEVNSTANSTTALCKINSYSTARSCPSPVHQLIQCAAASAWARSGHKPRLTSVDSFTSNRPKPASRLPRIKEWIQSRVCIRNQIIKTMQAVIVCGRASRTRRSIHRGT